MTESKQLLNQLRQLDAYEFEELVADVWEAQGWDTTVTSGSNDRGVDVIAEKQSPFQQKMVIQAKRYRESNKVGSPEIREYASLKQQEANVDSVVVVTTSSFTSQAKQTADDLNVKIVDGRDLASIIKEHPIKNRHFDTTTESQDVQKKLQEITNIDLLPDWAQTCKYTHEPPVEWLKKSEKNKSNNVTFCFYNRSNGVQFLLLDTDRSNTSKSLRDVRKEGKSLNTPFENSVKGGKIKPHSVHGSVFLVTEDVLHITIGLQDRDYVIEIPVSKISDAKIHTGVTKNRIEMYFEESFSDANGNLFEGLNWWVQPDHDRLEEKINSMVAGTISEYNVIENSDTSITAQNENEDQIKELVKKLKSEPGKVDDLTWMEFNGIYLKIDRDYYKLAQKILYDSDNLSPLNESLVCYLNNSDEIDYLVKNDNYGVSIGTKENQINPSKSNSCLLIFTTKCKLIVVVGKDSGDLKFEIEPENVKEAELHFKPFAKPSYWVEVLLKNPISIGKESGTKLYIYVNGQGNERVEDWVQRF